MILQMDIPSTWDNSADPNSNVLLLLRNGKSYEEKGTQTDFPFDEDEPLNVTVMLEVWPVSDLH